ncbi:TcfC E-set like domain-containing protein, partial [Shewanella algae]|uniref:TcfC E-set like domain-containing protein n=1 Tax=Shewanella algae TaxID=38313 RepID=UPI001F2F8D0C
MLRFKPFIFPLSSVALLVTNFPVYSETPPSGFEDYFTLSDNLVKLRNLDGTFSQNVVLKSKYDEIRLDALNNSSTQQIKKYLKNNFISDEYIKPILDDLIKGVKDENLCSGKLDECSLSPDLFQWVQNYNEQSLYLFVNPRVLSFESSIQDKKYHNALSVDNGIINSFDLYFSAYDEQDSTLSLNDKLIFGLPYGYFKTDMSLTNTGESELYEAAYQLDIKSYTFQIGHFKYEPSINSTDFLKSTSKTPQNSFHFGSSSNLLVGGRNSDKVITFYAPQSGNVKVYRDERLVYQNSISEGANTLSYSDLPYGRYEITLDIESSGEVISSQSYQIYNTNSDTLGLGQLDWRFSGGVFSESSYDINEEMTNKAFGNGAVSYRPFAPLTLAGSVLLAEDDSMFSAGASLYLIDLGINSEFVYSWFDDATHYNTNIGVGNINLSYEKLNNRDENKLASFMFGESAFSKFSVNTSYSFGAGRSLYAVYSAIESESLYINGHVEEQKFNSLSMGYSTPSILDSTLNLNLDYSDSDDNIALNILWTLPLSATSALISGATTSDSRFTQWSTTLRRNDVLDIDDVDTSLEVSNTYDHLRGDYQEASFNVNGSSDYARFNLNTFTSTKSNSGISAGISSTQVVTKDDFYMTDRSSKSYTVIDVDQERSSNESIVDKGHLSLRKNDKDISRFTIYKDETLVPLNQYQVYEAKFDTESVDLYNSGEASLNLFSHPGTVATLKPNVSQIFSFISSFNDLNERPIENVTCEGDGCLSVSEMITGVYRVTVLEGLPFVLESGKNTCLIPYELSSTSQLNFGENYCLPIKDKVQLVNIGNKEFKVYFLGAYKENKS